ncbi:MAG: (2Fe-2S)-binding protein [Opitutales bacterium]|nr:(2Fe-2S)-binding protein [Opitutales bacterium]
MSEESKKPQEVTINIDGKDYKVPAGMNLIDAVKKASGKEIPHYCYHPKLSVVGNCRMCMVEMGTPMIDRATGQPILDDKGTPKIGWMPKPAIACASKATDGLHVRTDSPMVQDCRKGTLEFLLINHPLDCPICDQAGECRLQEFATDYGRGYSRFVEQKNVKPKRTQIGPRVMLDDERCILCSRCIRFCREIIKEDVLGFVNRGSYSTLTAYPGRQLDSNYSLNTVDLCPVGALTDTDFRFKMRVWFLKPVSSICTESSVGVNTEVWSREGKIYRITPRENDAVNDSWMADSGRRLYKQVEADNRLLTCKTGGADVNFGEAVTKAASILGSAKLAIVGSAHSSVEEQFALALLAKAKKASVSVPAHVGEGDSILISSDRSPNTRGALVTGLVNTLPNPTLSDLESAITSGKIDALLVVREDITQAGIEAAKLAGVRIVYIGTHANATSQAAQVVIPIPTVFERNGTFINQNFRIQKFNTCVPAPADMRSELKVISEIAQAIGIEGLDGLTVSQVWKQMTTEVQELTGLSFESIPDHGTQLQAGRFASIRFPEGPSLHYTPGATSIAKA